MPIDPDTPVLVGAAATDQRGDDPTSLREATALMVDAARAAELDAACAGLGARIDWVGVPEGTWSYRDPGRLVAAQLGSPTAHTVRADVGVLQQELLTGACETVASGRAEVALVVGGEAKRRDQLARRRGVELSDSSSEHEPDETLTTFDMGIADLELERGLTTPASAFALIDNALRYRRGESIDDHRRRISELWAAFARVAADNPHAWDRSAPSAEAIREPTDENRMLAFPYTRSLASQWNVDQAAALFFCTVATARRLGIPSERWVFCHGAAISNHPVPVAARPQLDRSPGAKAAGEAALSLAGITVSDLGFVDLYSCFPAAVQVFADELGVALDPAPTVTGGMTFAGGPLNNYVIQALARLAELCRAAPDTFGLSSSVSTYLQKQGFSVWSAIPAESGFRHRDVTAEVAASDRAKPVVAPDHDTGATVVSYTVEATPLGGRRAVAVLELDDGTRTIGQSSDDSLVAAVTTDEWIGTRVELRADGTIRT